MKAQIRALRDKLLNLRRAHGRTALTAYLEATSVVFILFMSLAISQFFITADNDAMSYPNSPETYTLVQMKYTILASYPLLGIIIGSLLRWYLLGNNQSSNRWANLLDIGKIGILIGGLASAKLAGIVAIARELSIDSGAIVTESVTIIAFIPIVIIVLVAYITARELVRKV